jgi:hypothetical protein
VIVDESNCEFGRDAMMHATFFYYQLLEEGEFSCGQTSYWLFDDCTCWELLDLKVIEPKGVSLGVDETFIREAALVYILCMLVNQYTELEPQEYPKVGDHLLEVIEKKGLALIPEISQILESVSNINLDNFNDSMAVIFNIYVKGRFAKLVE